MNKINLKTFLRLMNSVAYRVQQLLSIKVAHNDLKPNNICVRDSHDGIKCVLIDFGMASKVCSAPLYEEALATGDCRKYTWIAPEVMKA